ncbi:MAG: DUF169 domain-containing protein [Phycisphaerae bacterium]|jgi:uncharacterized protein (DUF169 family)|nr:DUF169 domain-containing protein [Phycisphaerae bacterium]
MNREKDLANSIGVSFLKTRPAGMPERSARQRYCEFLGMARRGKSFCVPAESVTCPFARYYLGIAEADVKDLVEMMLSWGDVADRESGLRFLESMPRLEGAYRYIAFFPYSDGDSGAIEADVIIKVGSPLKLQNYVRMYSSCTGERVSCSVSGMAAACGECTAAVIKRNAPAVSVGCAGSRRGMALRDGEMLIAAPAGSKMFEVLK